MQKILEGPNTESGSATLFLNHLAYLTPPIGAQKMPRKHDGAGLKELLKYLFS